MTAILEVRGLTKVYEKGSVRAVDSLDLDIGRTGAVHGFLGPNGSGKTTTIRCALSLIRPTAGSVRVFGTSSEQFHEVAPRVGAIVENPKLFPNFSGYRNLALLADMVGIPRSRVTDVLGTVGLADRAKSTFGGYSLGMRQRLAIAAALLKDPDLLILDEPANGLDPAGIAEMRGLIRSIADEGKAVIVSSHQLAEIEQVCDDVSIIDHGALVISGPIEDVRRHAGEDEVVVTIARRDDAIRVLSAAGIPARPRPKADELVTEVDLDRSAEVTRALADGGLYLSGLRTERATLEQAFLNLTGGPPPPRTPRPADPPDRGHPAP